jgi:hypothetical protein
LCEEEKVSEEKLRNLMRLRAAFMLMWSVIVIPFSKQGDSFLGPDSVIEGRGPWPPQEIP